jgi:mannose-6-phosphate isomerase-like protein (cupin superfamily)
LVLGGWQRPACIEELSGGFMRNVMTLAAICSVATVTLAQAAAPAPPKPRDASLYIGEAELQSIMQKSPSAFSTRLFADTTYSTAFIRLDKPDQPHAHGTWAEVFVVKQGSGILETGGTITGVTGGSSAVHGAIFTDEQGKLRAQGTPTPAPAAAPARARNGAPGDLAGTAIEGGHQQQVKAGDVILIPAGVAHHWLKIDQPVVYLDTKFPKAE